MHGSMNIRLIQVVVKNDIHFNSDIFIAQLRPLFSQDVSNVVPNGGRK